ncbi:MAG: hypothetical protein WCO33_01910 [bacterium]
MRIEKLDYKVIKSDDSDELSKVIVASKPIGVTSHDVVDYFRHELNTRKVGHAGTLDPFAEGELIIASGKYTKTLDSYLSLPKKYFFKGVAGIKTLSGDNQEEVRDIDPKYFISSLYSNKSKDTKDLDVRLKSTLDKFLVKYVQNVPVFSSVKVGGYKLRELARSYPNFKVINTSDLTSTELTYYSRSILTQEEDLINKSESRQIAIFEKISGELVVLIPERECKIFSYENIKTNIIETEEVLRYSSKSFCESLEKLLVNRKEGEEYTLVSIEGSVIVESGTYIRVLIEDLCKEALDTYGSLYYLKREYDLGSLK